MSANLTPPELIAMSFQKPKGPSLNHWAYYLDGRVHEEDGICFASLKYSNEWLKSECFGVFYGGRSNNKPKYDKTTRDFVSFLVGPYSPWRNNVVPHLVSTDPDRIEQDRGFLFKDVLDLPCRGFYNFIIATRMSYEHQLGIETFRELLDKGYDPLVSAVVAELPHSGYNHSWLTHRNTLEASGFRRFREADAGPDTTLREQKKLTFKGQAFEIFCEPCPQKDSPFYKMSFKTSPSDKADILSGKDVEIKKVKTRRPSVSVDKSPVRGNIEEVQW